MISELTLYIPKSVFNYSEVSNSSLSGTPSPVIYISILFKPFISKEIVSVYLLLNKRILNAFSRCELDWNL